MADKSGGAKRSTVRVVDLDWRSVAVAIATGLLFVTVAGLVRAAPRTVTFCVIGGLLALALNPLVDGVHRRINVRRGAAVAVVLTGFVALVAIILVLLGPPAIRQARDLSDDIPKVVNQLGDLPIIGDDLEKNDVPAKVEDFIQHLPERLGGDSAPLGDLARSLASGVAAGLATLLVTITLLLDGERLVRSARRGVPRRYRERADGIGRLFYEIVGRYFAGSLLVAVIAGVAVLIVGLALGVPLTPLLAIWVAVFDLVPQIGGAAGGVPFVLAAFAKGPTTGVIVGIFFVLYLQFENHLLSPLIVGKSIDLSPPATMVAALVGVSAGGVPGALVAVPMLGVGKAVYLESRGRRQTTKEPATAK